MITAPAWRDPELRATALLLALLGALSCSIGPYTARLAVRDFGLGDQGYSALIVISTLVSVTAAIGVGIRADQTAGRRRLALWSCGFALAGLGAMTVAPSTPLFVLTHALLLPLSSTLFGQIFAQARIAASRHPPAERDAIMATIRAGFALPFVVVLPLWSLAFRAGAQVLWVYPFALMLAVVMLALTWAAWPADGRDMDPPSGLSLRAALAELLHAPLALRVLALGAVSSAGTVYWALLGLVLVPEVGRSASDVALYAGLVAGLEVPFMLVVPRLARRIPHSWMILFGSGVYALHLLGLPLLAGRAWLWLLILPAAIGGAITLTLPIAYLQDLLSGRPGTGAALMALQRLIGDILAAACFWAGTALSGYGLVALIGAIVSVAGALVLLWMDRTGNV